MYKRAGLLAVFAAATAIFATTLFGQQPPRLESGRGGGKAGAAASPQTLPAPADIAPGKPRSANQRTQVQVEVYELKVKDAHVPEINSSKLAQATRAQFLANLKEIGEARLVHLIDVPMLLDTTTEGAVKLGSRVPVVRDVAITSTGTVTPSVNYDDIGVNLRLRGAWIEDSAAPHVEAAIGVEWSGIGDSTVVVAKDVKLPVFTQFKLAQSIRADSGQSVVFVARQPSATRDDSQGATLGLVRLTLTQMR